MSLKRLHLFEFVDQRWFPGFIRNYMTDTLRFAANRFDYYEPVDELISQGIRKGGCSTIVDLASGGGGGFARIVERQKSAFPDLKIILTDFYPNQKAFEKAIKQMPRVISFEPRPISALDVPEDLNGFRTQFLSFHHFRPVEARQILANAVARRAPIGVFEAQKRDWFHLLKFSLSPIGVLFLTLFVRPITLGRIVFTYLIPLVPLFTFWDGIMSVLRTYSVEEMRQMATDVDACGSYEWNIGEAKHNQTTILYLVGLPVDD